MTDDGTPDDAAWTGAERLVDFYARQKALHQEFTDAQLAALDALWRAQRAGQVSGDTASGIEQLIRDGRVHRARKRLTIVRRNGGHATPG